MRDLCDACISRSADRSTGCCKKHVLSQKDLRFGRHPAFDGFQYCHTATKRSKTVAKNAGVGVG